MAAAPQCLLTAVLFDLASVAPSIPDFGRDIAMPHLQAVDLTQILATSLSKRVLQVLVTPLRAAAWRAARSALISLNAFRRRRSMVSCNTLPILPTRRTRTW